MYTDLEKKYAPYGDWRTLYAAFWDGRMTDDEAYVFGSDYMQAEKMLCLMIQRLIDKFGHV